VGFLEINTALLRCTRCRRPTRLRDRLAKNKKRRKQDKSGRSEHAVGIDGKVLRVPEPGFTGGERNVRLCRWRSGCARYWRDAF